MEKLYIETGRVIITNLQPHHLEEFYVYRSNPEVTKYQGFDVMSLPQCKEFIDLQTEKVFGKPGQWIQYAITLKSTSQLLGDCAIKLEHEDVRIAEIGITISPIHQQQGFAKETMLGILQFLFEVKQIHRVVETVDAENTASIQLMKSLGFRQEGHFIENIFFKGSWGSEYQFAMLNREWKQLYSNI